MSSLFIVAIMIALIMLTTSTFILIYIPIIIIFDELSQEQAAVSQFDTKLSPRVERPQI